MLVFYSALIGKKNNTFYQKSVVKVLTAVNEYRFDLFQKLIYEAVTEGERLAAKLCKFTEHLK
jgi:hypothetical protein